MYKKPGVSPNLEEVLNKLHKKPVTYAPVKYANSDILAAKKVLNRLLANSTRNEVSSIREVPKESNED